MHLLKREVVRVEVERRRKRKRESKRKNEPYRRRYMHICIICREFICKRLRAEHGF